MERIKRAALGVYRFFLSMGDIVSRLAVVTICLLVFLSALMRYVVEAPFPWSDEVCALLLIILTYMGLGLTFRDGMHIRIAFIFDRLPQRLQDIGWVLVSLITLVYVGTLFVSCLFEALDAWRLQTLSESGFLAVWPFYWVMPVGLAILFLALLEFTSGKVAHLVRRGTTVTAPKQEEGL